MKSAFAICLALVCWVQFGPFAAKKDKMWGLCSIAIHHPGLSCFIRERNPARVEDWDTYFSLPQVYLKGNEGREEGLWDRFLEGSFHQFPALLALERAVWVGDLSGFPKEIQRFYLEAGALPVLALSGQHVWGLVLVLQCFLAFLWMGGRFIGRKKWEIQPFWGNFILPVGAALFLYYTSHGNASMLRTAALFLSVTFMRSIGVGLKRSRVLFLSVVGALSVWPEMLSVPGYVLSFVAVTVLFLFSSSRTELWKYWLALGALMPVVMAPWTVFYFGKLSVSSVVMALFGSLLWEGFWIPLGFILPLLVKMHVVLDKMEAFFIWFLQKHTLLVALISKSYWTVPVINNAELFLLSFSLVCFALIILGGISRRAKERAITHCNSST